MLLAGLALAHRPHAVVAAIAPAPDFETSGRAWLIHTPGDACQLLSTVDHGAHWSAEGGALQADDIVDLGIGGEVIYALASDGTLWTRPIEGGEWVDTAEFASQMLSLAVGAGLALGGESGVWLGASVAELALVFEELPVAELVWVGEELLVRGSDSRVVYRGAMDGEFVAFSALPGSATAIAGSSGTVWAGTADGAFRSSGDVWEACGGLPTSDGSQVVTELVVGPDGATVYATARVDAYFVSTDACATWTWVDTGLTATFGGIGGVEELDQTFVGLIVGGAQEVVAGFDGVVWSADSGATWLGTPVLASDRVRGMAIPPGFPSEPRLFVGSYGGGLTWTDDGGASWSGSATGLEAPFNFDVFVDRDYATNRRVWWAGGAPDPGAVSEDAGATWETFDAVEVALGFALIDEDLWLFGREGDVGLVLRREEGEWRRFDSLEAITGAAAPHQVVGLADGRLLVATDRPAQLYVSEDDGDSWSLLSSWGDGFSSGLVAKDEVILNAAYETGLHRSADGGATWATSTDPVPHPQVLAIADDGTTFLAGGDGQIWRSSDLGLSWTAVGTPVPTSPSVLVTGSDFAELGRLFLGTSRGVYWSDDGGDSFSLLPRFQRMALGGGWFDCAGPCAAWDQGDGGVIEALDVTEVDAVRFSFEGDRLRLVASVLTGAPAWSFRVDGAPTGADPAAEWWVDGLEPGWHDVELRLAGGSARLEAAEALYPGEVVPMDEADVDVPPPKEADPCGCKGAGAWVLLPLGWGVRRRITRSGPPRVASPSSSR